MGYRVELLDATPKHIDQAKDAAQEAGVDLGTHVGDGRALPFDDDTFHATLLMGPLYHLQERAARLQSIREAVRITKPGGRVFGAAITRYAPFMSALVEGFTHDPRFDAAMDRDLASGRHINDIGDDRYFTTAFFHRPGEIAGELNEGGLEDEHVIAVEGLGWTLADFETNWADDPRRERILDLLERLEAEPSIVGASFHLMGIGTVPS